VPLSAQGDQFMGAPTVARGQPVSFARTTRLSLTSAPYYDGRFGHLRLAYSTPPGKIKLVNFPAAVGYRTPGDYIPAP